MSSLTIACLWCILQITLFSTIGIANSLLVARRYPILATTSTNAVIVMVFLVTLLITVRIPHWSLPQSRTAEPQWQATGNQAIDAAVRQGERDSGVGSINLQALAAQTFTAIKHPKKHAFLIHTALGWLKLLVAMAVLIGIARFLGAVLSVARIRSKSYPVRDERANLMLCRLAGTMSLEIPIPLRESNEIQSPAVVGWRSPIIVLPPQWQTWESHQLQAVLAHELAHISRNDFFWRVFAAFIQAVHFYHPLTHWLLRRLAYSQELAADQLAATTLGSRKNYRKALSQLAIRQDDLLLRLRAEPILLPTLRSHLIRRIEMLRVMECVEHGGLQRAIRVAASGMVVLLGLGMVALRGLAQSVEVPAKQDTTNPTTSMPGDTRLFRGLPTDPTIVGENELGLYSIKVTEILKNESVKLYLPLLNTAASEGWKKFFDTDTAPVLHLEMIDFVVGPAEIKIKRLGKDATAEHKNQFMLGGPYAVVRFHRDIPNWKKWIRQNAPAAKEMQSGDTGYFQLPVIPAIGPEPACIAARDSRTLVVFSKNENEELPNWASKDFQQSSTKWDQEWKSLDTGMISLLSSTSSIDPQIFISEKPDVQAIDKILENIEQIGYSIDWDEVSDQIGMKIRFCCQDQQAADTVLEAIDNFTTLKLEEERQKLAKLNNLDEDKLTQTPNESSVAAREDCFRAIDLLANYKANIIANPDETVAVEVTATLGYSLFNILQELIQPPEKVAQAQQEEAAK